MNNRENSFKEAIEALQEARKSQKKIMIMFAISGASMLGLAIWSAIIGQYATMMYDLLLVLYDVYIIYVHYSRINDFDMLIESTLFIEYMIKSQQEFHDNVEKIFTEAAAEPDASDVDFKPIE